ncbi:MAG TPA: EthD domain-containing protein [Variovorax sp.]
MLISLGFYQRKPGLTHEQFSAWWRERHGPLIRNRPEVSCFIKRYVQHHIEPGRGFPGTQPLPFDGFSESWFESVEARQQMHAHPFFREQVIPDEANFIDMTQTRVLMFDHQVVQIGEDFGARLFPGATDAWRT